MGRWRYCRLCQDILRILDYFWFDPETLEFAGFHIADEIYQPLQFDAQGRLWSQQLQFFTSEGRLLPTLAEVVEEERQQKELAQQKAERLAAKLRELAIDPDT